MVTPSKEGKDRYIAYFLEPSAIAPESPESPYEAKFREQKYDIRNGFKYSLLNPDQVIPAEKEYNPEEK